MGTPDVIEPVLLFGALFAAIAVPVLVLARLPLRGPYLSGLFVLALCPCLLTSLNAVISVNHFLDVEIQDEPNYTTMRLQAAVTPALDGTWASAVCLSTYSVAYWLSRRRRIGAAASPPQRSA